LIPNAKAAREASNPDASLVLDKSGNAYGTTPYGGIYGYGTVFELISTAVRHPPGFPEYSFDVVLRAAIRTIFYKPRRWRELRN
jgi:hypothetical protein